MMLSTKSESDITSLAPSSPSRSPKRPVYYVQSPSRDSHDGDKSSSMQPSPMESPSHPSSFGRHSRNSSASRFSGIFRSSSGRKGNRKRNDKGWPECNVIMEEGSYDEFEDKAFTRRFQALIAVFTFVVLFTVFCLIIWGASRPYKAEITVKSLQVHNFYVGEGADFSGVPTKMLTVNGSLKLSVYNPASIFGIHVSSNPVNLIYSEIPVATGQLKKYYQPRKSRRTVSVLLEGKKVPLYGAGSSLTFTQNGAEIPLILKLEVRSRGNVVGKLVRTKHRRQISCPLVIDSKTTKPIKFKKDTCTYD
ncbi:Late embryogenesis abundant protein, LEA-14 [Corchorus olitorius]|uniref:Late embryogenesis abundant protein, LEA-14 n=1 Tax=Corchorus olitorius TaxID=93759 RepID=A0A1R3H8P6_9ROSI|nr:Late embryogenesis abundant protein, LEA-14 [Corchorus olitorius]